MTILRIDSSPRSANSNSRTVTDYLVAKLDDQELIRRDLAQQPFPPLAAEDLVAIHGSTGQGTEQLAQHEHISDTLIGELLAADTLVIGVSMHNFSVPAVLKQWIDYVMRIGKTFRYSEQGPVALTKVKTVYLVVASGGTPIGSPMDFASGYLSTIFSMLGAEQVHVIDASGSKRTPQEVIAKAQAQIDELLTPVGV